MKRINLILLVIFILTVSCSEPQSTDTIKEYNMVADIEGAVKMKYEGTTGLLVDSDNDSTKYEIQIYSKHKADITDAYITIAITFKSQKRTGLINFENNPQSNIDYVKGAFVHSDKKYFFDSGFCEIFNYTNSLITGEFEFSAISENKADTVFIKNGKFKVEL